mgnify:CR=1 FL=1
MTKKIIISGLLGWIVLIIWIFLINGILGFKSNIDMKQIADEQQVYGILKSNISESGRYICNPSLIDSRFPENEPVYSIQYAGIGHEFAGLESLYNIIFALISVIIATVMLSMTNDRIRGNYSRRLLYFTFIGLFLGIASELPKFGIGGYPLSDAVVLAVFAIIQWTVVGLIVAWQMKPFPAIKSK